MYCLKKVYPKYKPFNFNIYTSIESSLYYEIIVDVFNKLDSIIYETRRSIRCIN